MLDNLLHNLVFYPIANLSYACYTGSHTFSYIMNKIMLSLPSPKLNKEEQTNGTALYPYYAGFSHDFVDVSIQMFKKDNMLILDPWTGTGLTNRVAQGLGISSIGLDINPAMATVAKANLIIGNYSLSIKPICSEIISKVKKKRVADFHSDTDPLLQWFDYESVKNLRILDYSIYKLLVNEKLRDEIIIDITKLSDIASFFYIVLFKITKSLIKQSYPTSNPSWIKTPKKSDKKISLKKSDLLDLFSDVVGRQVLLMSQYKDIRQNTPTEVRVCDSQNISMHSSQVDLIVTSPPYCTRIDYAVLTKPELAVLGFESTYFKKLRKEMIGTTAIDDSNHDMSSSWGESCHNFLKQMSEHTSVASKSYYLKNHIQYFSSMEESIKEINRVLKPDGDAILVVQDSYYKDLHNNLPLFIEEIAFNSGLKLEGRVNFEARSLSNINSKSLNYRSRKPIYESVLHFKK